MIYNKKSPEKKTQAPEAILLSSKKDICQEKNLIKLGFTCASFQGDFLHRVYTGELGWGVGKSCSPGKHQKSPKRVGGELC